MIRPLRRRHRLVVHGLAALLPLLFAVGIASRPRVRGPEALPERLAGPSAGEGRTLPPGAWGGPAIETRLFDSGGSPRVWLRPQRDTRRPDVLVYWLAAPPAAGGGVPPGAVLLGTLAGTQGRSYELPAADGALVLYSLVLEERVAVCPLPGEE